MSRISRAADIDRSLLKHLANHPHDLVRVVCDEMNVTRPAVLSRVNALAHKG